MQLSELFDLSLRVYRTLGWRILAASVVPSLFSLAGVGFLFQYVLPGFFTTNQGTKESSQVIEAGVNLLLGIFVACPLLLIGISLATTYISPLVSDFMHGLPPNYKAAREAQMKSAPRMLVLGIKESVLATSGIIVGALFLFLSWAVASVPGLSDTATAGLIALFGILAIVGGSMVVLYIISIHAIVAPVCAIEGAGLKTAGKRSKELLKSRPFQGSGYEAIWSLYILMSFLVLIIALGFSSGVRMVGVTNWAGALNLRAMRPVIEDVVSLLPYYFSLWVVIPVWSVTTTIIYFERRVRLEGYDIEALAADVWHPDREDRLRA